MFGQRHVRPWSRRRLKRDVRSMGVIAGGMSTGGRGGRFFRFTENGRSIHALRLDTARAKNSPRRGCDPLCAKDVAQSS